MPDGGGGFLFPREAFRLTNGGAALKNPVAKPQHVLGLRPGRRVPVEKRAAHRRHGQLVLLGVELRVGLGEGAVMPDGSVHA